MGLLRTRRGLGLVAFATIMTAACVLLGFWQLDRYELRVDRNSAVQAALGTEPVPLESLAPADAAAEDLPTDVEWRSVVVSGRYDPEADMTLRLRPVDGQSGVHVLTPFVLADGTAVLVDRGFLATATRTTDEVVVPDPAPGSVELVGRIRLSENRDAGVDPDSTPPSIRFVNLGDPDLQELSTAALGPVWLERVEQAPVEEATLTPIPPPRLSSGPSLIYAVQWFLFGVIAVVGFIVLIRREPRDQPDQPDQTTMSA